MNPDNYPENIWCECGHLAEHHSDVPVLGRPDVHEIGACELCECERFVLTADQVGEPG